MNAEPKGPFSFHCSRPEVIHWLLANILEQPEWAPRNESQLSERRFLEGRLRL